MPEISALSFVLSSEKLTASPSVSGPIQIKPSPLATERNTLMRVSCSLLVVKARVGISALLAPMAWVHATIVGLSWSVGYPRILAIRCELAADDWSAHVQCLLGGAARTTGLLGLLCGSLHTRFCCYSPRYLRCSHMCFASPTWCARRTVLPWRHSLLLLIGQLFLLCDLLIPQSQWRRDSQRCSSPCACWIGNRRW